jgi:hypothetical protein
LPDFHAQYTERWAHANECLIGLRPAQADVAVMAGERMAVACTAALLAGSILAGCADFGDTTTVVAPTVTKTVPAPAATSTTFRGTTEQGLPFVFSATSSAVVQLSFDWRAPCADGKVRSNSIRLGAASIQDGSFSFDSTLETGGVAQVEGSIQGDSASGTFSRSKGTSFGIDCEISDVHWDARAGSGFGQSS